MRIRIIVLIMLALALTACRGNPPRPDTAERDAGTEKTPYRAPVENRNSNAISTTTEPQQTGSGGYHAGDGPGSNAPASFDNIPDAVPRAEPMHRYANRPYTVLGKRYTPLTSTGPYKKRGVASWYGKKFHGQRTSIGEVYDMYGMTAASTILPIPSYAKVTNLANQKSVIVRINDRGPFMHERIIDLSYTAAAKLGIIGAGQGQVEVESLNADSLPIYKDPVQVSDLPEDTPKSGKVFLQLGAFNSQQSAEDFLSNMRRKLGDTGKQLSTTHKNGMIKVRIGPYGSADNARESALELESRLGFKPMLSLH